MNEKSKSITQDDLNTRSTALELKEQIDKKEVKKIDDYFIKTEELVSRGVGKFFLGRKDDELYDHYYQWYQDVALRIPKNTIFRENQKFVLVKTKFKDYSEACYFTSSSYDGYQKFNAQEVELNYIKEWQWNNSSIFILHPSCVNRCIQMKESQEIRMTQNMTFPIKWGVDLIPQEFKEKDTNCVIILCLGESSQKALP